MESNFVVVALAGIVAVTILVVVAWKFGSSGSSTSADLLTETGLVGTAQQPSTGTGTTSAGRPARPKPKLAKLVVAAASGDCWLQVRAGSANGELLYEGTLQQGQTQRFVKWRRLWIQLGAPVYLTARLNGHRVRDFPERPSIVAVTAKGVRVVSTV
jgi:hypothetical protein